MAISKESIYVALQRARGLNRFREAHIQHASNALVELARGRKETHWMWFIFPQGKGLGHSRNSRIFALSSDEARRYQEDWWLWANTRLCLDEVVYHVASGKTLVEIFGRVDAMKFRSFLELFSFDPEVQAVGTSIDELDRVNTNLKLKKARVQKALDSLNISVQRLDAQLELATRFLNVD